ncbi:putative F-box protein At4g17565 [Typha latifolia]|uniref:putative F-box protein At4g17565 n=1 Tax=Typha latifolia TaxID=4733 RepID=UPI003C2D7454
MELPNSVQDGLEALISSAYLFHVKRWRIDGRVTCPASLCHLCPLGDRYWPNRSKDLLVLAFQRVDISDLVRSAVFCRSWLSAASAPCLTLRVPGYCSAAKKKKKKRGPDCRKLVHLSEDKTYTVSLFHPAVRRRFCIGSAHGWVITADNKSELHLLNPITGTQIDLPRMSTFGPHGEIKKYTVYDLGRHNSDRPYRKNPEELRYYIYEKATLSSSPSEDSNYIIMLIHNPYNQLSFARAGDQK